MKKIFDFGKIDFEKRGAKRNRATVTIELKEKENGQKVFTASGSIWDAREYDIIAGGQCLDDMRPYLKGSRLFLKIFKLWEKYHLNDMRPYCEHQKALGWDKLASEKIKIYRYKMTGEAIQKRNRAEREAMDAIKTGETYQASAENLKFLSLSYIIETETETLGEDLAQLYKLAEIEEKAKGWTEQKEHSAGILCKPCPVCGYKYGTAWKYEEIGAEDLKTIYELFGGACN